MNDLLLVEVKTVLDNYLSSLYAFQWLKDNDLFCGHDPATEAYNFAVRYTSSPSVKKIVEAMMNGGK